MICVNSLRCYESSNTKSGTLLLRDAFNERWTKSIVSPCWDISYWSSQLDKENVREIISLYTNDYWYDALEKHILSSDDLAKRGFPVERPDHPGCAMIDYTPYPTDSNNSTFCFININILNDKSKEEKKKDRDSTNCNSSSEHEQENLTREKKIKDKMKKSDDNDSDSAEKCDSLSQQRKRECARCHKLFCIDSTGKCLYKQRCIYHWGKLFDGRTNGQMDRKYWTCCKGLEFSTGCETGVHVSVGLSPGLNGPLKGYVRTLPLNRFNNKYRICALDCEMCYTEYGFELTRVTVISLEGKVICNDFVKPNSQILDYNTRFSGITEEHMKQKSTLTLGQVQRKLLTLISAETIVIGHNLASDFRALHIIHKKVVDTTVLIPDPRGFPYTLGLKALARRLLQRNIQENTHDSREDAQAALDLALHYISTNK
ncbi:putative exonuclease GOR isoform X3 [Camponotus floridanus]|uniref:putative exonuclease GOR isoform X3 n=1 Tax=Camponotus floridanus TaxID=104421 RepID=UPI00059C240D|nr:putative exonuclease GOR isoform X3 [Camponotus floridanus]